MSDLSSSGDLDQPSGPEPEQRNVRLLKAAVYIMGVLLVAGTILLIGAIIWKASRLPASVARGFEPLEVTVPAGGSVRSVEIVGDRMAVAVESPEGTEIVIIDLRRGTVAGRVRLTPAGPPATATSGD
jgi:hypothetical protein